MEKELFTKSIAKEKEPTDGKRTSVMSRHTGEGSKTPDKTTITAESYDEWRKEFAPPEKLVGAYYRKEVSWEDFEKRYLEYLRSDEMKPKVEAFAKRCTEETITLMCIEDDPAKCHRRLLAEELQKYQPNLKIVHK